ncbi:MAG: hypothetical protein ACK4G4_11800 [Thermus sp.]|uniref:hypothetical protein n=1 Tax=Thermus sp. TaxID=275 RepID=UPI00391D0F20
MESFFSRFKWENRDLFLAVHLGCRGPKAAKDLTELRGVIAVHLGAGGPKEERLQYYHEGRLHSGLGYVSRKAILKTPREVLREAIEGSHAGGKYGVQT